MAVLTLTACDLKEDHKFDRSPDERLIEMLDEYNDALTKSPNGWFLALDSNVGGCLFYMTFNDKGRVTMLSDFEAKRPSVGSIATTPKESSYIVRALQMPSLLFDTYNYLHIICDPQGANNGGSNGTGLGTDFEFDILRYDGGVFYLRGSYNHQYGYLIPATAAEAEAVMNGGLKDIHNNLHDYLGAMGCPVLEIGDRTVQLDTDGRKVTISYMDGEGSMVEKTVDCYMDMASVTADQPMSNVKFFEPMVLDGVELTGMRWNGEALETVSSNGSVKSAVYDNEVPPFPLSLGLGKAYNTLTFTVPEDYVGTISQKYLSNYYEPARTRYTGFGRTITSLTCTFTTDANNLPIMRVYAQSVTNSSGAQFRADFNLYYTENEDGTITFTDRVYANGNALNYGRYMRGMIDIFNYIEYQTYLYSYNSTTLTISTPVTKRESYTFKIDWVSNNTPGLSGKIGGLYRVDDPEIYFCGVLSSI